MAKVSPFASGEEFLKSAKPEVQDFAGSKMVAQPKTFSTGSYGWNATGKQTIMVDGKPVEVQVSCNYVVVGSKPAA